MPRYVSHERFWEIDLRGATLSTRAGELGTAGEASEKIFATPARAASELDLAIARKLARGFVLDGTAPPPKPRDMPAAPLRDATMEAAIKDLDDTDALAVYGDWLAERGDPRGTLIALMRNGKDAEANELLAEHREHFLGDLHELSSQLLHPTWRNGFIDKVHIEKVYGGEDDEDRTCGGLLRAVLDHASGAFLRSLSVGTADGIESSDVHYDTIVDTLEDVVPAHLERISIGDWTDFQVSWTHAGCVDPIWALPRLRSFTLHAGTMSLGRIASRSLVDFEIITGGLTAENIAELAAAKLPNLEELIVWFGSAMYGASGDAGDVAKLLASDGLPKLRSLGLVNAEFTDDVIDVLARSPLLKRIAKLDLSKGTLSSAGAGALVAHAKAFAHLESLDLGNNWLTHADAQRVAKLCRVVIVDNQNEGDDRYVTLGE